jgi:hypothetical protein
LVKNKDKHQAEANSKNLWRMVCICVDYSKGIDHFGKMIEMKGQTIAPSAARRSFLSYKEAVFKHLPFYDLFTKRY